MEKYKVGDVVKGIVTGFEKYGVFLSFEDDYVGLIHISELSEHFVKDVTNYANLNDEIPCVIIEAVLKLVSTSIFSSSTPANPPIIVSIFSPT